MTDRRETRVVRRLSRRWILGCSVGILGLGGGVAAGPETPAIAINARSLAGEGQFASISLLDRSEHTLIETIDVGENPRSVAFGPDGEFLYVVNGGHLLVRGSYVVKGPGSLSVVDLAERKVVGEVQLGYRPLRPLLSRDRSRLYVFSVGKKNVDAELTVMERSTLAVAGRLPTGSRGAHVLESPNGRWLYLLHGPWWGPYPASPQEPKKAKKASPKLTIVDARELQVVEEIGLASMPIGMFFSPDERRLYLVCGGGPGKKGPSGRLHVLDPDTHESLATVDLGKSASVLWGDEDTGLLYFGGATEAGGRVTVVDGSQVVRRLELPGAPLVLEPGPRPHEHIVLCEYAMFLWNPSSSDRPRRVTLPFVADEVLVDGRRRAYVGQVKGSDIAVIDVEARRKLGTLTSGRAGVKVAQTIGSIVDVMLSIASGSTPAFGPYVPRKATTRLALREDGKFLYALNSRTDDLTIFDLEELSAVKKLPTGNHGYRLEWSPDKNRLFVFSLGKLTVVDAVEHSAVHRHDLDWGVPFADEERDELWAPVKDRVVVFSSETGAVKAEIPNLPRPVTLVGAD